MPSTNVTNRGFLSLVYPSISGDQWHSLMCSDKSCWGSNLPPWTGAPTRPSEGHVKQNWSPKMKIGATKKCNCKIMSMIQDTEWPWPTTEKAIWCAVFWWLGCLDGFPNGASGGRPMPTFQKLPGWAPGGRWGPRWWLWRQQHVQLKCPRQGASLGCTPLSAQGGCGSCRPPPSTSPGALQQCEDAHSAGPWGQWSPWWPAAWTPCGLCRSWFHQHRQEPDLWSDLILMCRPSRHRTSGGWRTPGSTFGWVSKAHPTTPNGRPGWQAEEGAGGWPEPSPGRSSRSIPWASTLSRGWPLPESPLCPPKSAGRTSRRPRSSGWTARCSSASSASMVQQCANGSTLPAGWMKSIFFLWRLWHVYMSMSCHVNCKSYIRFIGISDVTWNIPWTLLFMLLSLLKDLSQNGTGTTGVIYCQSGWAGKSNKVWEVSLGSIPPTQASHEWCRPDSIQRQQISHRIVKLADGNSRTSRYLPTNGAWPDGHCSPLWIVTPYATEVVLTQKRTGGRILLLPRRN